MPLPHCDVEHLRMLLADQLPAPKQAEIAEHLSQCAECRQTLEAFAGDARWWTEVETCFRTHEAELSSTGGVSKLSGAETGEAFTTDFVVDFLEPCDQPESIGRLGEFEIQEVIGQGGMGIVLKGFHRELGRYVAVKVMAPHLGTSGAARQRFIREARAAAAIVHPNVMPIHAVCTTARLPYLVMPCLACESLQQRIDRQGPLEVKEILRIGIQVSAGLAAAHAQGLVHRDIKPANILLEKGVDRVMLTDFGLARAADDGSLTRTGIVAGTPQYMSPEQALGDAVDSRSDLFSLGSVFYTMAAGRPPFRAETTLGILRRISDTEPRALREVNPDIPSWLSQIVSHMHAKAPRLRLADASAVADLLQQCLAHVQQPNAVPLPESLRSRSASLRVLRHPRFTRWAAPALSAAVVIGLVISLRPWLPPATNGTSPPNSEVSGPLAESPASAGLKVDGLTDLDVSQETARFHSELEQLERVAQEDWSVPKPTQPLSPKPVPAEDSKP